MAVLVQWHKLNLIEYMILSVNNHSLMQSKTKYEIQRAADSEFLVGLLSASVVISALND